MNCKLLDDPDLLYTAWARYKALLAKKKLQNFIENVPFTDDTSQICREFKRSIRDVEEAMLELSDPREGRLIQYRQDALTDHL